MLLGQLFLAEERGRNIMAALFCDTDRAGKSELAQRESKVYNHSEEGSCGRSRRKTDTMEDQGQGYGREI